MEVKLVTIIILPYSKAQILKSRLEENEIECILEDIHIIEGSPSYSMKVKIMEEDVQKVIPILDEFVGKKEIKQAKIKEADRHILVPVDFSPGSLKSSKMAFNLAQLLKVKLVFMHCYINPLMYSIPFSDTYAYNSTMMISLDQAEKTANESFQKFISKLSAKIGEKDWKSVRSEYIIKSGYPDEDILAYAESNSSDMIVIGTGGNAEQNNVVGSVTADVIYNAKVPVLVVPDDTEVKAINEINKVLYATNFDEKDFTVVDNLINLLKPFDVQLVCVHVGQKSKHDWDLAKLEGMKDLLKNKYENKDFDCRLIIDEDIPNAIERFIKEENIDMLSLTTHKRNMISRLFNPSFARKMVFHTQIPLLVFHA